MIYRFSDLEVRKVIVLTALSLIEAAHVLVALALILSYFPPTSGDLPQQLLAMDLKDLKPEREMLLFRIFVIASAGIYAGLYYILTRVRRARGIPTGLYPWIGVSLLLLILECYLVLLLWLYGISWARGALAIVVSVSFIVKACWPWLRVASDWGRAWAARPSVRRCLMTGLDLGAMGFTVLLMFVPDVDRVVSNAFLQDNFYHINSFYMSPGWAFLTHNVLNVDVISLYSVVSPIIMAKVAEWTGGFTYHHVMTLLIGGSIVYYLACYVFLRVWLRSFPLAFLGILLAVKLQVFHPGVAPIVWRFPSTTVIRYVFDMPFFILLVLFLRSGRRRYLVSAAAVVGLAVAYMMETGVYLLGAFYVCVASALWMARRAGEERLPAWFLAATAALPFAVALSVLAGLYGGLVFQSSFWTRNAEYVQFFLHGFGSLPVYASLQEGKNIWAFAVGMLVPVVYCATMLAAGSMVLRGKIHRLNLVAAALSVYGLGLYHYFVNRSAPTNYDAVIIPCVCVLCYWLGKLLDRLSFVRRSAVLGALIIAVLFMLFLNEQFVNYPNVFNLSRKDWGEEKDAYFRGRDLSEDVQMIRRWTKPGDKVPVVGSYATPILMDAQRSPFFYYDPLLTSRPPDATVFAGGTYVHTKRALQQTMEELETRKPEIVFIERKLFVFGLPMPYYQAYEILGLTVLYLRKHYDPVDQGKYFIALKRKAE